LRIAALPSLQRSCHGFLGLHSIPGYAWIGSAQPAARNPYAFVVGELQYRYNQEAASRRLAGGVRVGARHNLGRFDDRRCAIERMKARHDGRAFVDAGLSRSYEATRSLESSLKMFWNFTVICEAWVM
jgi:hypothetical protein